MVREGVRGKIVFVSSVLGYFSMVGWAPYAPGKFAIRGTSSLPTPSVFMDSQRDVSAGLAESLHSEFKLYDIAVHCFFHGNIATPGYVTENTTKPAITARIEEADPALKPEVVAKHLLAGTSLHQHSSSE